MALEILNLKRVFKYKKDGKDVELADPNPEMDNESVLKFYAGQFPELTNAIIEGPTVLGDKATYVMTTKAGKLG